MTWLSSEKQSTSVSNFATTLIVSRLNDIFCWWQKTETEIWTFFHIPKESNVLKGCISYKNDPRAILLEEDCQIWLYFFIHWPRVWDPCTKGQGSWTWNEISTYFHCEDTVFSLLFYRDSSSPLRVFQQWISANVPANAFVFYTNGFVELAPVKNSKI